MEKVLESLVATAPSASAVIVVVVLFLRHITQQSERLKDLHIEHLEARKASQDLIRENTRVIGEVLEVMRGLRN